MMKLATDWKKIIRHAWSTRLLIVAGVLQGLEFVLPFFEGVIPRGWFAGLGLVVTGCAFVARILSQRAFR